MVFSMGSTKRCGVSNLAHKGVWVWGVVFDRGA